MSRMRPDWYRQAKGSLTVPDRYREDMKRYVTERIGQRQSGKNPLHSRLAIRLFSAAGAVVVVFAIIVLLFRIEMPGHEPAAVVPSSVRDEVTLTYRYAEKTPTDLSNEGYRKVELQPLNRSDITVRHEQRFPGVGTFLLYTKNLVDKENQPFMGIGIDYPPLSTDGRFYEIGPGSMSNLQFLPSEAFGEERLRLSGTCGPTLSCSFWFKLEGGAPFIDFRVDAETYEEDLDGDGVSEVVAIASGGRAYIYKSRNGRIEFADVIEALGGGAQSVAYDPASKQFTANADKQSKIYRYDAGRDALVRIADKESH